MNRIDIGPGVEVIIQMPVGEIRNMIRLRKADPPATDHYYSPSDHRFYKRVDDGKSGRNPIVAEMKPEELDQLFS